MFGYVRPQKPELKVKEYEMFKAAYCGLCAALKDKYGASARYMVNYDLTFLAMLISPAGEIPGVCSARCPASPCRKKQYLKSAQSFETAADYSVILTYWKLVDAAGDGGFKQKLYSKPLAFFMKRKYKKAAAAQPFFAGAALGALGELNELERAKSPSLDAAADKFAKILQSAAHCAENEEDKRTLAQILYQLGRFIYILDAKDDYANDVKTGGYNPLLYRFETGGRALNDEENEQIRATLDASQALIASTYELREKNAYDEILSNIIYLGLDSVKNLVLLGRSGELKSGGIKLRSKE